MKATVSVISVILPIVASLSHWACVSRSDVAHPLESKIDSVVKAFLDKGDAPSYAVGIRVGPDLVFTGGYGLADLEHEVAATPQSVYRIASLTKQFTAAAILQLVEGWQLL